jgi:hypothetical protein
MKIAALILPLILNFSITSEHSTRVDIEIAIQESDFVGFVSYSDDNSTTDNPILFVNESFKGDVRYLNVREVEGDFEDGVGYLLITKKVKGLVTKITYPVIRVEDLSIAVMDVLHRLECSSEALRAERANGFCTREYDAVCGCDNKTYGNICEMMKNGILKFKPGRCK